MTSRAHYAGTLRRWLGSLAIALAIAVALAVANVLAWRAFNPQTTAPDAALPVAGLAYNAFGRSDSPLAGRFPTPEAIAADMRLLRQITPRLRTYSAAELPLLPELAGQAGLRLTLGVWLDRRFDNNAREIAAAIDAAGRSDAVERIVAGNETRLHGTLTPAELHAVLDRLRAEVAVPVSTAEPWHVWLAEPELAEHVDFITVHLLPYWEGVPRAAAVDEALRRYDEVRARFPHKPVVIGEIGWPSGGDAVGVARPDPAAQAIFIREFLARATAREAAGQPALDYYLMEAIDQPWKRATEGPAGAHWGVFDAWRQPKFAFAGPVETDPYWRGKAGAAALLGSIAVLPFLLAFAHLPLAARLAFAAIAQVVAALAVLLATLPLRNYLDTADVVAMAFLAPALLLMAAILLAQSFEFVELYWPAGLRRVATPRAPPADAVLPMVSIHLACRNEPPAQVIAAIDSLCALDWPDFEILVIDNNTADPALWQPLAAHVERLQQDGETRVRFFHLPRWPGYKAGALNFALQNTDPRAAWIAVVDADYRVDPDWLRKLAGHCADPRVSIVQAPQAHRDWQARPLARMMNWEYEGFFRIGMHHRHERDAIVQHGTMTLIRAAELRAAGGWEEDCIVEDTELGLRLLERGGRAVYVDRVLGTGLVPADFAAYRRQRRRWAEGAMQILRRHFTRLVAGATLARGQRYHFLAGWLPWIGDALHLVFTLAAIFWTLALLALPEHFKLPHPLFAAPLAVFFLARLGFGPLLYARRVPCGLRDRLGAALAGMGLSHAIARGVLAGLAGGRGVFHVTPRGTAVASRPAPGEVREDAALMAGLLTAAGALLWRHPASDLATVAWGAILLLQSLPYLAALACAFIGRGRS